MTSAREYAEAALVAEPGAYLEVEPRRSVLAQKALARAVLAVLKLKGLSVSELCDPFQDGYDLAMERVVRVIEEALNG